MPSPHSSAIERHASPPLGIVAIVFMVLFCAGLIPVTTLGGKPAFPGPWEPLQTITAFFQARPSAVVLCAFLQFGAAIPLGIFTASAVSRFRFLGITAAGPNIALFGGFSAAFVMIVGSSTMWTLARPGIAENPPVTQALYYFGDALGGPAYAVSLGLLIAGLSIPALMGRLVPRWIAIFGLVVAVIGELSWLNFELPAALPLIPLTRFPGFIWMIAMGFALPSTKPRAVVGDVQ